MEARLTIFTFAIIIPLIGIVRKFKTMQKKVQKEISDCRAGLTNVAHEAFSNIRTVKSFAGEANESEMFSNKN